MSTTRSSAPLLVRVAGGIVALLIVPSCTDRPTAPPIENNSPPNAPSTAVIAEPVVLVGAGNIARCDAGNDEETARLLDEIPGTVFTTGDLTHDSGEVADFEDCYGASWGRHRARTRPAPGDLEYRVPGGAGYFSYFGDAAGDPGTGYYSYDIGSWHVIVLNSNIDMAAGSPQEQWLRDDLQTSSQSCILAYWHHPRFSSYSTAVRAEVKPLWDALYAAEADVVLNGHYRLYERFAPQTPTGAADPSQGIRQFTVGTGGHGINSFGTPRPNSEVRLSGAYGVLKLSLDANSYSWEFVPIAGQSDTDAGTGTCHGPPSEPPPNEAPTAHAGGPYQADNTVSFDGSASGDPDGETLTYEWDFGDGTTGTGVAPVKLYSTDGIYTATLLVTDALGAQSAPATTTVAIANVSPAVDAGGDLAATPGTTVGLTVSITDPGGTADAPWTWSVGWGDGASDAASVATLGTPITASHTYAAAGQYTVHVTVSDDDGGVGSDDVIVTVSDPGASLVLVGAGNIARCDRQDDEATAALLDGIPGMVFTTGDNVHTGAELVDFENCYGPSWGRHRGRTRPAAGNYEYVVAGAAGYFAYFGAAAGVPGKGYYSYDYGEWHIVVLNSSIATGAASEQVTWLKGDLEATRKPCVLAYWDHPRFSSYGTAVRSAVKPLWDVLYAAQADVVINGHYRLYERFAPQTPNEVLDVDKGIRQFTVGTGGHGVQAFGTPRPNSEVRRSGIYGVLKLTLGASGYSWEFVPIAGQTFSDAGTGACHGRPDEPPPPNERPAATISEPVVGTLYAGGDVITYSGSATDPEEGALPAARLTWWADFHHDTHTHPFLPVTSGTSGGTVTIPSVGEVSANVWYRFHLVATDATGQADTVVRDVLPRKVTLSLATQPAGLQVTLDGQPRTTPFSVTAVVGIQRELGVVSPQTVGSSSYTFSSWSDGGSATHVITTPGTDATYTATYAETPNTPPTVVLSSPSEGGSAQVNTPVTVSANAGDTDGSIQQVEFFDGTTSIGVDATSPYSISWTPATTGTRSLTARATDNLSAQTTSAPVSFTVTPPSGSDTEAPTVTLTAPADQATSLTGAVTLTATATDNVGVAGVQFQVDGENLGTEDSSAPYSATLPATSAYTSGMHVLRARARDAAGNLSTWDVATVTFGGSVAMPAGFGRTTYTSGLTPPTAMAFAPDGRLFICQQDGQIRVVPAGGGAPLSTPFHTFTVTNSGEQGLLGIAFHPNFTSNGWIYVYYTSPTPVNHNRISRVQASAANPNVSTGAETVLLDDLPQISVGRNHNGGALHFSPVDGKLYVAIGDQATGSNAQSMTSRFGKVLRYNDDLTIPTDNPFYATATGVYRAIWALGLRNPFTFAVQPATGRMMINDVGEATWEEVNEGVAGSNYGWPTTEGPTSDPRFRGPIFAYQHGGRLLSGYAVVGGAFYNPATSTFPAAYLGHYFFGDWESGWINRLDPANDNAVYAFARLASGDNLFALEVGSDGALYALGQLGATFAVYRYQFQ